MSIVSDRFTTRNGLFPRCPRASGFASNLDYVNISATTACSIFYMLQDSGFTTTGSATIGGVPYDIDYTMRFGESALDPFTPTSIITNGSYYDAVTGNPAALPHRRQCLDLGELVVALRYTVESSTENRRFSFYAEIAYVGTQFRLYYSFRFQHGSSLGGGFFPGSGVTISNPAWAPAGAPNSGNLDFAGVTLSWVGGEHDNLNWTANAASTSATESALQFYFY